MSRLLIIIFFTFSSLYAQFNDIEIDSSLGSIKFERVIHVDSMSKKSIYMNARVWFVNTFVSANHVLQMDDKEEGILIGKGYSLISVSTQFFDAKYELHYTINVLARDGRYKFTASNLYFKTQAYYSSNLYIDSKEYAAEALIGDQAVYKKNGYARELNYNLKEQTLLKINELFNSFKVQMDIINTKKDDW